MNRAELKNLIQGVVVTTPTPFDEDFKLDLARTTDITRQWIEDGLGTVGAPLKIAAAGGEGPDLTDDEWHQLLRTTVNAAGSGAVIMTAIQPRNTLQSIEDAKKAQDLSGFSVEGDIVYSDGWAIPFRQISHFNHIRLSPRFLLIWGVV